MFKSDNFYNLKISLFLGITGALLANLRFSIPGITGGTSDAREIAALISIFFLTKWPFSILVGILVSLGGPYNALPTTLLMHIIAIPLAWFFINSMKKKKITLIKLSTIWVIFVLLLYVSVYSTVFVISQIIFQQLPCKDFFITYKIFLNAVFFESIMTSLITSLSLVIIKTRTELKDTNLKLLEELQLNKAMKSDLIKAAKYQSISSLSGGIAHDFNNLITGISGSINLIALNCPKGITLQNNIEIAQKACKRAISLTNELMLFARGKIFDKKIISIREIIMDSSTFLFDQTDYEIAINLATKLWDINCDTVQIEQVIQNLLINAKQSIQDKGKITIIGINIEYQENNATINKGRYIKISITDTGKGIEQKNLNRIFDPYFTTKKSGNGLGLATVNSIIQNHEGYIFVNSVPGQGTTFTILIPAVE